MRAVYLLSFLGSAFLTTANSVFPNNQIPFPDCSSAPLKSNARASALIANFTLAEKVANLVNDAAGVPQLSLPSYEWWNEALHGFAGSHGINSSFTLGNFPFNSSTQFPSPIILGAAFDDQLINEIADVMSTEARAFSNDLRADPRWCRGQETPGEDPYHVGRYAYSYVTGLQGGVGPATPKVIASCKHFAGYDVDNWNGVSRYKYNALINTQNLAEYYLPGFRSCFRDAKAGAVMCSYNAVNGYPSCANNYLLEIILRGHWGWNSSTHWVTGDCGAVDGVYANHGDGQSAAQGVAFALSNGTDVDCGTSYSTNLMNATTEKNVTEDQIDLVLKRLYGSLVTVGYFDSPADQPYRSIGWSQVNTKASKQLSYTALVQGITLLKNDDNILPIQPKGQKVLFTAPYRTIPVPIANTSEYNWEMLYSEGLQTVLDNDTSQFAAAVIAAKDADVVVYFGLIDESLDFIQQLAAVGGGQVDDTTLLQNSNVKSLLWIGYPGQEYGPAVIDVPMTDQSLRPSSSNPGRTYRWYNNSVIPFGTGLHYTNFSVSWAHGGSAKKTYQISKLTKMKTSPIDLALFDSFRIEVKNVGSATSDYVALLFLKSSNAGPAPYPIKTLVSYARASSIAPGATVIVDLKVNLGQVARNDASGNLVLYTGSYTLEADVEGAKGPNVGFEITGSQIVLDAFPQPK
ncbi:glycoside hydrolase superfamily [Umbelopsis sp. PMI_123]|nr:glycoside hydrolase superfamily [Umbelopsis sp. PMI_123]